MADDYDESDVFEINDFTIATDLERFINSIEEVVGPHGWKLDNTKQKQETTKQQDVLQSSVEASIGEEINRVEEWEVQRDSINYVSFPFVISHFKLRRLCEDQSDNPNGWPQAILDAFDFQFDFPQRAHALSRWYGLKEFLVLSPANNNDCIEGESRRNLLWSAITISLSNLKCCLPMFIQVNTRQRAMYYGACLNDAFRSSFEMIHLKFTPHECNHVQGMIETFKEKLKVQLTSPVYISIRFTYSISDWPGDMWCQEFPDIESDFGMEVGISTLTELPFGPLQEPVKDLQLATTWPCLSSDVLVDDDNFSDLDPMQAPVWSLKSRFIEFCPTLLHDHLKHLLDQCHHSSHSTTAQIIRSLSRDDQTLTSDVSHVLDRLANPTPKLQPLTSAVNNAARKVMKTHLKESPLPEELLKKALDLLFPDAWHDQGVALKLQASFDDEQKYLESDAVRATDKYRYLKAAPKDSLTYFLALCVCIFNHNYGGEQAIAHLWQEFVLEMRFRYENNILIPKMAQTTPNLNYCLVHQKLQMLNCCIKKRQQRSLLSSRKEGAPSNRISSAEFVSYKEFARNAGSSKAVSYREFCEEKEQGVVAERKSDSWNDLLSNIDAIESGSDSDEFFEAQEDLPTPQNEREGVLRVTEMNLLATDEPLCIPITQDVSPMTEDMLAEQQDIMERLGTSAEAAKLRTQMQCASLLSDMESFKAANLASTLSDFVRWYSPNDWLPGAESAEEKEEFAKLCENKSDDGGWEIEDDIDLPDDNVEGHLSLRMRMPGNTWLEVWETARPVPAHRQKRLFDDTKEAEKVLHFLSNLTSSEIILHLFPVFIQASLVRVAREEESNFVTSSIDCVLKEAMRLQNASVGNYATMKSVVAQLYSIEATVSRVKSLRMKLSPGEKDESMDEFLGELLSKSDVPIDGGSLGKMGGVITALLVNQKEEDEARAVLKSPPKLRDNSLTSKHKDIPLPIGREYILRATTPVPNNDSRACPQRLFTAITAEDFRMAGCFTKDAVFV